MSTDLKIWLINVQNKHENDRVFNLHIPKIECRFIILNIISNKLNSRYIIVPWRGGEVLIAYDAAFKRLNFECWSNIGVFILGSINFKWILSEHDWWWFGWAVVPLLMRKYSLQPFRVCTIHHNSRDPIPFYLRSA